MRMFIWSCGIAVLDLVGIYGMCTISNCFVGWVRQRRGCQLKFNIGG